ncbi:hypothetical protein EBU99_12015 [bacterium]|nr:hypothetical protein [bacterium]
MDATTDEQLPESTKRQASILAFCKLESSACWFQRAVIFQGLFTFFIPLRKIHEIAIAYGIAGELLLGAIFVVRFHGRFRTNFAGISGIFRHSLQRGYFIWFEFRPLVRN